MVNIGIVGKMGAGKTLLADYLVKEHGYTKESFAGPMKWIAKEFFDLEKGDPEYREFMQKLGTDWFRSVDENVWVKHLIKRAAGKDKLVIDDVRFPNEAEGLLCAGWTLVYLDCPEDVRIDRVLKRDGSFDAESLKHPSETGVDEIAKQYGCKMHYVNTECPADEVNEYVKDLIITEVCS